MNCKETTEQILRYLRLKRTIYGDDNVHQFLDRQKEHIQKQTEYIESLREKIFGTNKEIKKR